jgi:hypothetical protein
MFGFVVEKVALGRVFSEYFGFLCQSSFHQLLHNHPHLSSGAGTKGQKLPQYKGLSPTPLAIKEIGMFMLQEFEGPLVATSANSVTKQLNILNNSEE